MYLRARHFGARLFGGRFFGESADAVIPDADIDVRDQFVVGVYDDGDALKSITMYPGESRKVSIDLFPWCANLRRSNEWYAFGEVVWPELATGFAYQAQNTGRSAARVPVWPRSTAAPRNTVTDGSVVWRCISAGGSGLEEISAPSITPSDAGLVVTAVSVSEYTKLIATYEAPASEGNYELRIACTINAVPRMVRHLVRVEPY